MIKPGARGLFVENKGAVDAGYYIRSIDADLWKRVKARAAHDGLTVRAVILALLKLYAAHGLDHLKQPHRK